MNLQNSALEGDALHQHVAEPAMGRNEGVLAGGGVGWPKRAAKADVYKRPIFRDRRMQISAIKAFLLPK